MSRGAQNSSVRASRFGMRGLGFPKSFTSHETEADDWYIPYNGPYELPMDYRPNDHPDSRRGAEDRGDATVFGHKRDLQYRLGIEGRQERGWSSEPEDRKVRNKLRAPSTSARGSQRPSTHLNTQHAPASTFRSGGGIGESPTPIRRQLVNSSVPPSNRLSLSNLLSFGGKKAVHWPSPTREFHDPSEVVFAPRYTQAPRRKRASQDDGRPLLKAVSIEHLSARHSALTEDEDYYHSYYSTLATRPKKDPSPRSQYIAPGSPSKTQPQRNPHPIPEDEPDSSANENATTVPVTSPKPRPHPYAYVFPSAALCIETPRSAPPAPSAVLTSQKQKAVSSSDDNHTTTSRIAPIPEHLKPQSYSRGPLLKGSISTPNLRGSAKEQREHSLPRGKERWLSAETWCDALLFPRPRFKIKHGSGVGGGTEDEKRSSGATSGKGSGRIVSPPGTPILREEVDQSSDIYSWTVKKEAVPAYSVPPRPPRPRGLTLPSMTRPPTPPIPRDLGIDVVDRQVPRRPAKDDLELPSPIPSLNRHVLPPLDHQTHAFTHSIRVLEEGDDLDRQRKAWQQQAEQSFQNKRTRSLSRSRARSLTHSSSHRRRKDVENVKPLGSIDFLAARSLLGTQSIAPTISASRPVESNGPPTHTTSGIGTTSGTSHSYFSHSHTNSKSSNKGHSRNPSWSKSAMKMAKSAGALCGRANENGTPMEETTVNLEHALNIGETKRVRMANPSEESWGEKENPTSSGHGVPETGPVAVSPAPSGATGEGVGIAVTSEDSNVEQLRILDHPYGPNNATQVDSGHRRLRSADYAGPHPTTSKITPVITVSDVAARHRHPYAHPGAPSSPPLNEAGIRPHIRTDSGVSPSSKMWAQLFPGEVREILPEEITYSPDLRTPSNETPADDGHSAGDSSLPSADDNHPPHAYVLPDPNRYTRLGVVEALTSAFRSRRSLDSGGDELVASDTVGSDRKPDRTEMVEDNDDTTFITPINGKDSVSNSGIPQNEQGHPFHPAVSESSHPDEDLTFGLLDAPDHSRSPPSNAGSSSGSSPAIPSQGSSPPVSPRPLGSVDDLDHFRDLFYRPEQSASNRSPSQKRSRESSGDEQGGSGTSWSSHGHRTASGLTNLAQQLSQELEELTAHEQSANQLDNYSIDSGQSGVGFRGQPTLNVSTDLHFVLTDGSISHSPLGDTSPLRLNATQRNQPPSVNIPEDVLSSRASSLLEPSTQHRDENDTFGLLRVGVVEAVNTPPPVFTDHRASGHLSLVDDDTRRGQEAQGQQRIFSHASSLQPWSADFTRSSYMTSDTGASRISGLSDFPEPPASHITPAHISVLASFFSNLPAQEEQSGHPLDAPEEPDPADPPSTQFSLRRMTFGGEQDTEQPSDAE